MPRRPSLKALLGRVKDLEAARAERPVQAIIVGEGGTLFAQPKPGHQILYVEFAAIDKAATLTLSGEDDLCP